MVLSSGERRRRETERYVRRGAGASANRQTGEMAVRNAKGGDWTVRLWLERNGGALHAIAGTPS
jgi:hypothetical protein